MGNDLVHSIGRVVLRDLRKRVPMGRYRPMYAFPAPEVEVEVGVNVNVPASAVHAWDGGAGQDRTGRHGGRGD